MGDLDGLLVVAVEQAVAAPYASGRLAEAGARVLKIERPEGDLARHYDRLAHGESAYFVWLNRGKESVRLDLRTPGDRVLLDAIVARADVFLQNLAPGAIGRLGFAPAVLRARHPGLITVSISGYGETGPMASDKAYDLIVQAESGLAAITGTAEGPARVGVSVADIACGMTAYQAILQALIARGRTGRGRHIAVSLFDALADWMNVPYLQAICGGRPPGRSGLAHPSIAPYGAFAAADGKAVLIAIQTAREWERFCAEVLDRPGLATDPRFATNPDRVAHRAALDAIVAAACAALPGAALVARLRDAGIAHGRVNDLQDLARHVQARFVEVETPSGPVRMLAPGALADGVPPRLGPVPALGAHTEAVRAEFAPPPGAGPGSPDAATPSPAARPPAAGDTRPPRRALPPAALRPAAARAVGATRPPKGLRPASRGAAVAPIRQPRRQEIPPPTCIAPAPAGRRPPLGAPAPRPNRQDPSPCRSRPAPPTSMTTSAPPCARSAPTSPTAITAPTPATAPTPRSSSPR